MTVFIFLSMCPVSVNYNIMAGLMYNHRFQHKSSSCGGTLAVLLSRNHECIFRMILEHRENTGPGIIFYVQVF